MFIIESYLFLNILHNVIITKQASRYIQAKLGCNMWRKVLMGRYKGISRVCQLCWQLLLLLPSIGKHFATLTIPKASGRYNRRYVCWEARAEYSISSSRIASFRHRMSCRGMSHCHGTRCQGISICKRQVVSWYKAAEFSRQQIILFCACIWHFSSWWHPSQARQLLVLQDVKIWLP